MLMLSRLAAEEALENAIKLAAEGVRFELQRTGDCCDRIRFVYWHAAQAESLRQRGQSCRCDTGFVMIVHIYLGAY